MAHKYIGLQALIDLLGGEKKRGSKGEHICLCPAHNDKDPSLSVREGDKLEAKIEEKKALRESYRSCCFYLAELLVPTLAKVVLRFYLEHKSIRQIANEIQYSYATVKRYKRQADDNLSLIEILYWDRVHVPMILLREGFQAA